MFACLFERVSEWMSVSMVWHFGDAEKYISIVIVLAWFLFCSAALLGLVLQRCDFDAVGFVVVVVALIHSFVKSKSRAKREKWKFLSLEKLLFILWYYLNFMFWVVLLSIPFISGSWAWAALVELSLYLWMKIATKHIENGETLLYTCTMRLPKYPMNTEISVGNCVHLF